MKAGNSRRWADQRLGGQFASEGRKVAGWVLGWWGCYSEWELGVEAGGRQAMAH